MKNPVNLYVILGIFVVLSVSYFIFYMLKRQEGLANKKEKSIQSLIEEMNEKNAKLEEKLSARNEEYIQFLEAKKTNLLLSGLNVLIDSPSTGMIGKDSIDVLINYLKNPQQA